jgi:hypothetical protein
MKPKFHRPLWGLAMLDLLIMILLASVLGALTTPKAQAQQNYPPGVYQPTVINRQTNWTGFALGSTSNVAFNPAQTLALLTNAPVTIRQNYGDAWMVSLVGTNPAAGATTGNVTLYWDVCHQGPTLTNSSGTGTNWTTVHAFTNSITANGTNPVVAYFYFDRSVLNDMRNIFLTTGTNTMTGNTNGVQFLFVDESHSNQP